MKKGVKIYCSFKKIPKETNHNKKRDWKLQKILASRTAFLNKRCDTKGIAYFVRFVLNYSNMTKTNITEFCYPANTVHFYYLSLNYEYNEEIFVFNYFMYTVYAYHINGIS